MISQEKFINESKGRKVRLQNYFVKVMRLICKYIPLSFARHKKKTGNYVYMTICRACDFDMVKCSLYSLYKYSEFVPKSIIVVSDGSWKLSEGMKYFSRFNLNIEFISWNVCSEYYSDICPPLNDWANKHIWGKKMASILFCSESNNILFSDPDILWFNTPITEQELNNLKFKISIDNSHNYDMEFIKKYNYTKLLETNYPINCGAVYISGGYKVLPNDALTCIEYEALHPGRFAEQTVFAIADLHYNSRWAMNEITSEISDLLTSFTGKTIRYPNMIARHYLWRLKWIYWKDFFKIIFE